MKPFVLPLIVGGHTGTCLAMHLINFGGDPPRFFSSFTGSSADSMTENTVSRGDAPSNYDNMDQSTVP